jgi:tryptophanyl-tRNA synthetase
VNDLKERYVKGAVGDVEVKQKLAKALNAFLDPIREKRAHYESHIGDVRDALAEGTRAEKTVAEETMAMVRDAMGLNYLTGAETSKPENREPENRRT